mgnify:CR=1 FL=1
MIALGGIARKTMDQPHDSLIFPAYRKLGGRVVYSVDDLQAWAERGAKQSTSDPGVGTVLPAKRHDDPSSADNR